MIIATIGRMNPPTTGHAGLIKYMLGKAVEHDLTQINLILSDTIDNTKNPLECEEKRTILYSGVINTIKDQLIAETADASKKTKIKHMKVKIVCMNDDFGKDALGKKPNKIVQSIFHILKLYGYDIEYPSMSMRRDDLTFHLVIGEDRGTQFGFIGKLLSELTPSIHFEESVLPRSSEAMSATKVRTMALTDPPAFFEQYNSLGVDNSISLAIQQKIAEKHTQSITKEPSAKTRKSSVKPKTKQSVAKTRISLASSSNKKLSPKNTRTPTLVPSPGVLAKTVEPSTKKPRTSKGGKARNNKTNKKKK
jgi:hypothetical protein